MLCNNKGAKMVFSEENEDSVLKKHQALVGNLKLDEETAEQSWNNFQKIRTNFTLEVRQQLFVYSFVFNAYVSTGYLFMIYSMIIGCSFVISVFTHLFPVSLFFLFSVYLFICF